MDGEAKKGQSTMINLSQPRYSVVGHYSFQEDLRPVLDENRRQLEKALAEHRIKAAIPDPQPPVIHVSIPEIKLPERPSIHIQVPDIILPDHPKPADIVVHSPEIENHVHLDIEPIMVGLAIISGVGLSGVITALAALIHFW